MAGFASCVERCKAYFLDTPNISKPSGCLCSWSLAACTAQGKAASAVLLMLECVCLYVTERLELSVGALGAQKGGTFCRGIHVKTMDSRGICFGSWLMHLLCPACRTVHVHCEMTVMSLPCPFSGTLFHSPPCMGNLTWGCQLLCHSTVGQKRITCS